MGRSVATPNELEKARTTSVYIYRRQTDDAEHMVLWCPRWVEQRRFPEIQIGEMLEVSNII